MANNGFRWSVGGVPVNPEDHVSCESPDGSCGHHYGRLRDNVEGPPACLEEIARLKAENERQGTGYAKRCADIVYLNMVLNGSRAKQDDLKAENEKLKAENISLKAKVGFGYLSPPTVQVSGSPLESVVANLKPLAASLGYIEPAPLRDSVRLDVPAGSTITITLPKD